MKLQPSDLRAAYESFMSTAAANGYNVKDIPPSFFVADRQASLAITGGQLTVDLFGTSPTSDLNGTPKLDLSKGLDPNLGIAVVAFDIYVPQLQIDPADTSDVSDVLKCLSRAGVTLKINGNTAAQCRGRDCIVGDASTQISAGDTSSFVRADIASERSTPIVLPRPYLVGPTQRVQLNLTYDTAEMASVAAAPVVYGRALCLVASKTSF